MPNSVHFSPISDKVIGTYEYEGETYDLLEYRKDPRYKPQARYTNGIVGGPHVVLYVDGPHYIRIPTEKFRG